MRGFARGLKSVRQDDGDDLAVVGDLRRFQRLDRGGGMAAIAEQLCILELFRIFVGHDVDDTAHLLSRAQIETVDAALCDRTGDEIGIGRIGQRNIGCILRLAGHFGDRVIARNRLTHIGFRFGSGHRHGQTSIAAA